MTCEPVTLPGGARAIVCSSRRRQRCCKCGGAANLLCDWKTPTARKPSKTCNKPICEQCATSPAIDKDLCPEHAVAFAEWKARR